MVGQSLDNETAACDYLLVGAGLSNCLLALALARFAPRARVVLVDRVESIGARHTWSFHASDAHASDLDWLTPLVAHRSNGHEVRFERYSRVLEGAYCTVTGDRLRQEVERCFRTHPNFELLLGQGVVEVGDAHAVLANGQRIRAALVIDARGPEFIDADISGYQKFVGLELEWERPHGIERALLMDAEVEQLDGFRFMYVLPFGPTRALVEDTYFSDTATLDVPLLRERIFSYVRAQGLSSPRSVREETGVLPLPRRVRLGATRSPLRTGYAGGFLHPTTGYSFPVAARLASFIARRPPDALFGADFDRFLREHARQLRFGELLNRLLFQAFEPERRSGVFERFYRLPEATIARFYALETTPLDRTKILCGRPPRGLSLKRALLGGLHP